MSLHHQPAVAIYLITLILSRHVFTPGDEPTVGGWKMVLPSLDNPMRYHQVANKKEWSLANEAEMFAPTNLE